MLDTHELLHRVRMIQQRRRWSLRHDPLGRYVPKQSRNALIRSEALVIEPIGDRGAELWMTYSPMRDTWLRLRTDPQLSEFVMKYEDPDALNGYVAFPKRSAPRIPRNNIGNIVQYFPVHGGVTYAVKDSYAAVWGFDTGHCNSANVPRSDPQYIRYQCTVLYHCLVHADKVWTEWKRAPGDRRLEIAQSFQDSTPDQELGFQALITSLTGQVG